MNHLLRSHAPISDAGWKLLDEEARERLTPALAARKLVDFSGPHGWQYSATNLGRAAVARRRAPCEGVSGLQRRVLPLVELRADFELSLAELRDADRGADDADLGPLDKAAHQIAVAENVAVFHGWKRRRSTGIAEALAARADAARRDARRLPAPRGGGGRAAAAQRHQRSVRAGAGRRAVPRVVETAEHGGYPLLEHLRKILDGPIVWAPGVERRGRAQPARRRLRVRVRAGSLDRLRPATTVRRSGSIWRRASASTSRRRRPRSHSPHSRPIRLPRGDRLERRHQRADLVGDGQHHVVPKLARGLGGSRR